MSLISKLKETVICLNAGKVTCHTGLAKTVASGSGSSDF